jgi:DNA-binding winged helix-turn-helix (wHTH) protein/tetratricopeptide (TPR) repeat protein
MSLEKNPSSVGKLSDIELAASGKHSYRFKSFELNPFERQLLHDGEPVSITPKAFEILMILVSNAGHLVRKEEIMDTVWSDAFVEEANLTRLVHTLRKTLGEDENGNRFIETVAKQGYRFVAVVIKEVAPGSEVEDDVWPDVVAVSEVRSTGSAMNGNHRPLLLIAIGAVATIALIAILSLSLRDGATDGGPPSIAVLPFRANTANRDEDIELALTDELINQLNQSKGLRVRSFSVIKKYANSDLDPAAIGAQQKVDYLLVSNYFVDGDHVKGTAELYNTATGMIETTYPFEGTGRLFGLAETIASSIRPSLLAQLKAKPVDVAQKHGTANEDAWRSYLHGFKLVNKRTKVDAEKAVLEFQNAIRIDPGYAQGYVGLAQAHQTAVVNGADPALHCPQSLEAGRRAIDLDPQLGESHTGYGGALNFCAEDKTQGEAELRRGVELDPNSYYAHTYLGIFLAHRGGSPDESIEEINKGIDLNPDLLFLQRMLGRAYFFSKRYDDAIPRFEKAWQVDPGEVEQALLISSAYELKGDLDRAFEWFIIAEDAGGRAREIDSWKTIYSDSGWQGVLRKRFERAEAAQKNSTNDYFEVIHTGAPLGEIDKAFGYFAKACEKPGRFLNESPVDPYLDHLRADPRWRETVSRCWKTGDAY